MTQNKGLELQEIRAALDELNHLSMDEYGRRLEDILLDPSPAAVM